MRCVDLFAGCGGMSLGFQLAGFDVVAAYDNWEQAIAVYSMNFSHPIITIDLKDEQAAIQSIGQYQPEIIVGGPPCQDFSSAGKRDVSLGRAEMTNHFANIVCAVRPEWFVMENVEQAKKSPIMQSVARQFEQRGYGLSAVILNASYCGVPQARNRFFLIGHFSDRHHQLNGFLKDRLAPHPMTVRDYLGDKLNLDFYYRHPRNYNRRGIFSIDEPSPTIRGVNRPIPRSYQLSVCDPEGIDLGNVRPLTTIERSYLQTFPEIFDFQGTKTNLEQMIGNAVPVELARYVAQAISRYADKTFAVQESLFEMSEIFQLPLQPLHRN